MRWSRLVGVAVSVAMLAAIGLAGIQVNRAATRSAEAAHRTDGAVAAAYAGAQVRDRLQVMVNELSTYATAHPVRFVPNGAADRAVAERLLRDSRYWKLAVQLYSSLGPLTLSVEKAPVPPDNDPQYMPLLRAVLNSALPVSGVLKTPSGRPAVAIGAPVLPVGRPTGMLVAYADLATDPLRTLVSGLGPAEVVLVDSSGTVVTSTGRWAPGSQAPTEYRAAAETASQPGTFDTSLGGQPAVGFVASGLPGDWTLLSAAPRAAYFREIDQRGLRVNLVLLAVLLLAVAIVVFTWVRADSKLRRAADQLRAQATRDSLTGLPNRRLLYERLAVAAVTVLYLDLDHFKPVNDDYGHEAGDELLRAVATRISQFVRPSDTLARVGGDEFVLVAPGLPVAEAEALAERILAAFAEPFELAAAGGIEVRIGTSVGIGVGAPGDTPDDVLRRADEAMYRAKRAGRSAAASIRSQVP